MSEIAITTTRIVQPITGEVFDLEQPEQAAAAVQALKTAEQRLAEMRRDAELALVDVAIREGRKTFRYGNLTVEASGGPGATEIDTEILRAELTKAGCPESRINEAIKEEITYKANRSVCKQLAGANPAYAAAVEAATYTYEKRWTVKVV